MNYYKSHKSSTENIKAINKYILHIFLLNQQYILEYNELLFTCMFIFIW